MNSSYTGIHFTNENEDRDTLSILDYLYYYNGAGVAIGDINNDGLTDIYFASNTRGGGKLYLNEGGFHFEDITARAGVGGQADWSTGVTMADVNGDGFLDIYVCAVGDYIPRDHNGEPKVYFQHSRNQLFINNGNNTFTERAAAFGLDIQGYNTQAVFFDYDHDGDLDMFLLQHSTHQTDSYGSVSLRNKYSEESGGKLFRNDGGHFTNVTKTSGIYSSALGYGLGVGVADFNGDGFDDIYVSNDFHENDYYYVNQGNGTFKEMNALAFGHESKFSMGSDIADINNDGWPDIMTADMLPEDETVLKSSLSDDPLDIYMYQRSFGYSHQFSRNCLQLNTGRGMKFADIALYSGVAATDWSWSPLIADFDLDGKEDIFVTDGIKKRPNDLDFVRYISNLPQNHTGAGARIHDKDMLRRMPSGAWHSYVFQQQADLRFADRSADWGFDKPSLSQGAAYADLDGDGDLDLVTNTMNGEAGIYRNHARDKKLGAHYLRVALQGKSPNTFAIGAKVFLFGKAAPVLYKELQTVRGFMSSSEPVLDFGLGARTKVDSLLVIWPTGDVERIFNVEADRLLTVRYDPRHCRLVKDQKAFTDHLLKTGDQSLFTDLSGRLGTGFTHHEDPYFDFNDQLFLPHELSTQGPKVAVGDVNGDGREDFFICGAKGQAGGLFLQQAGGSFIASPDSAAFVAGKQCEGVDALFFDADNDGDLDIYVVSGGNVYSEGSPFLADRLYLNDGKGHFTFAASLPKMTGNKSCVRVADYDHDGDLDIFVGGRCTTGSYSTVPNSYLLLNDGHGHFHIGKTFSKLGMVTDASWTDVDHDGWPDLVVVGEWMQPVLLKNDHGTLHSSKLLNLTGLWSGMKTCDINGDGFDDILLGNTGLNSKLIASLEFPLKLFNGDIAGAGHTDQILALAKHGKYYPFRTTEDLQKQLPYLKKAYLSYSQAAGKTVDELFGNRLDKAAVFTAQTMASMVLVNDRHGHFVASPLPAPFQWTPIFCFGTGDFDGDGVPDLIAGGNFFGTIPYEGRYDAMPLAVGLGRAFSPVLPVPDAFTSFSGEIRSIQPIRLVDHKRALLIASNNGKLRLFGLRQ